MFAAPASQELKSDSEDPKGDADESPESSESDDSLDEGAPEAEPKKAEAKAHRPCGALPRGSLQEADLPGTLHRC